ncbi:YrhB domain-containing protein [Kitasatospora arboriphila]|uniref:Immunity protein 35 domain-containing protein n=1 Tax=Kitasatospora arboriphila TaxID=258052 RepID=A0ABN1U9R6_9ACTN
MINKDQAVRLVELWLERERVLELQAFRWAHDVEVFTASEHEFGWLVVCQSREYVRTRDPRHALAGLGPFLVDGLDGSLHHIPVSTYLDDWEHLYRHDVRGLPRPDPVAERIREALAASGRVAAMRELRQAAPGLLLAEARAYVDALQAGAAPDPELAARTTAPDTCRQVPIETLTGPNGPAPHPIPPPRALYGLHPERPLGHYRELFPDDPHAPSLQRALGGIRCGTPSHESELAAYLRAGTCLLAATALTHDVLDPDKPPLGSFGLLTDGTWFWYADLVHYVEHHHVQLPPSFLAHARANDWTPPEVSDQEVSTLLHRLTDPPAEPPPGC